MTEARSLRVATMWAVIVLSGLIFTAGCEREEDAWVGGAPLTGETAKPPTNDDAYDGVPVAGDEARDGGDEIYKWVNGMDVRCIVNDAAKTPGAKGTKYYISDLVTEAGALAYQGSTFAAKSFTSARSGKKYKFMGWTISRSATPLVTANPLTLNSFEGTLRAYWITVGTEGEPTPTPSPDEYGGVPVYGDQGKDGGDEIHTWVNGMDVRCVINDASKTPDAKGTKYYISDLATEVGALVIQGNTFTAKSFTSPRSGKKYRFMGWTISRSATPLVTTNPLTLNSFEGTLRAYWMTVGTEEEAAEEEPPPEEDDGAYGGAFTTGSESKDGGGEIYKWVSGMDIRLLANDASKIRGCASDFYFIAGSVVEAAGALKVNGKTFTAKSFTSSKSGKKYRFMGWTIDKSANPLVKTNPLTLSQFKGTLRAYWCTVE